MVHLHFNFIVLRQDQREPDLDIHERTVKLHRTAITTKLAGQSVAELTRLVHEAGGFDE